VFPDIIGQRRHTQDLCENVAEVTVKTLDGLAQHCRWTGAQEVVDLVVRQATTEQPKLDLCVVHLLELAAHLLQYLELLDHKLCGELLCADRRT
jgi:hypothetical protein